MNLHSITEIPLVDLVAQQEEIHDALWPVLEDIFRRAAFVGGSEVNDFEASYARFIGAHHCVAVGNGTDAIEFALRAADIGPGAEVIVPANTFIATAEAVLRAGATPVLADVDARHLLLDPEDVAERISERTAAIIPVHLFGQMAPMERMTSMAESVGAVIIEDAAQAQGARRHGEYAGTVGLLGATSFYPGKNLGAAGDGGAVTTNSAELARRVRLLGSHGSEHKYLHESLGFNSRLDTVQAAVLQVKLARLEQWNARRRNAAGYYQELLRGIPDLTVPTSAAGNEDVWHLFVVRVPERDLVLERLRAIGINAAVHYPVPLHLTSAWKRLGLPKGKYPVTEAAAGEILSLPIHPHILPGQQEYIVEMLTNILEELR